ncbi:MAG: hypothetical protein WAK26_06920, partial [Terracidiphilus sp.]
ITNANAQVSLISQSEDKIISVTVGVGASGTVGVSALLFGNVITSSIESEMTGSTVYSGGQMQLKASDDSSISSVGLSVAASGTVSVGAIVAANVVTNTVAAEIDGSTVNSGGALDLTALNDSTIYSFTGGVAASGVVGVQVSFAANVISNTTEAEILNDGATASNVTSAGALTISATDASTIDALAFGVAGSGTVAVGVGMSANVITNTINAGIEGGSTVTSDSTIGVSAISESVIRGISLGVSGSGIVAVQVSVMGNVIANTVTAEISGSDVSAAGNISVDAEEKAPDTSVAPPNVGNEQSTLTSDVPSSSAAPINLDANILAVMVSVAGTGIVAVNGAFSGNVITDTVEASVVNSTVLAGVTGTKGNYSVKNSSADVDVTTNTNSSISALTVGVAGSGIVAVNVTGFGNAIANTVESIIGDQSTIVSGGAFDASAIDQSEISSLGVSVAGTGAVAVGALLGVNVIDNTIAAEVEGSNVQSFSTFTLNAESESSILGFTAGIAGAGGGAGVLSLSANTITNTIEALVTTDNEIASTVNSSGAAKVTAVDSSTIDSIAFGVTGSGGASVGAALGANVVANKTTAEISGSTFIGGSTLSVSGSENAVIRSLTLGISGSGGSAVQVTAVGNVTADDVTADIVGSTVTSSGDISLSATDGTPTTINSLETTSDQDTQLSSDTSSAPISLSSLLDSTNILSIVIGVAGSASEAINVELVGNIITDQAKAYISGSKVTSETGEIDLSGLCTSSIAALTAGLAGSGGLSVNAAGLGNIISDTLEASIVSGSTVQADTGINQTAADSSSINSFGLGISLGGTLAGEAIVAVNNIGNTLSADISGSTVTSSGSIQLSALSEASVNSFVGGVSASVAAAAGLSFAYNDIHNTVDASILRGANVHSDHDIDLTATDASSIESMAIAVSVAGLGAAGAAASVNTVANDVNTAITSST